MAEDLVVGEVGLRVGAGDELHSLGVQPFAHGLRLGIADGQHFRVQRALAQALFEHAGGMQQLVGDDGVIHAHAALVEDAHDGLFGDQLARQLPAEIFSAGGQLEVGERLRVAGVVHHRLAVQPLAQARQEAFVLERLRPQRGVRHTGFGEGAVQIEHAHQAGPLAAPVGDGENGALVGKQAAENVVGVLPHSLHHNQRSRRRNVLEDLHPLLLAADEPVFQILVVRVSAAYFPSKAADGFRNGVFHFLLSRPADLVRGQSQVAGGNEDDWF